MSCFVREFLVCPLRIASRRAAGGAPWAQVRAGSVACLVFWVCSGCDVGCVRRAGFDRVVGVKECPRPLCPGSDLPSGMVAVSRRQITGLSGVARRAGGLAVIRRLPAASALRGSRTGARSGASGAGPRLRASQYRADPSQGRIWPLLSGSSRLPLSWGVPGQRWVSVAPGRDGSVALCGLLGPSGQEGWFRGRGHEPASGPELWGGSPAVRECPSVRDGPSFQSECPGSGRC